MSGHAEAHRPHQHSIGFNLGAIMLMLALGGVGVAYLIDAMGREARGDAYRLDTRTTLTRTLGGRELEIPLAWFRYEEQRIEGFAKQIDLRFELPLGVEGRIVPVDITLLPRSRARPSSSLLDGVYLHQFLDRQLSGVPGLVGKPLRPEEGYADETVWYDALSFDPFVAKCSKPIAQAAASQCLRTVYLGPGIAAVYAFPEEALQHWRDFDPAMTRLLGRIGAL